MSAKLKIRTVLFAFLGAAALTPQSASAITVEVAKKCSALTAKAYPPRVVGNPAAGLQNGSYQDFRNYFNKCVASGGNPPEQANQKNTEQENQNNNGQENQKTQSPPNDNNSQAPNQNK